MMRVVKAVEAPLKENPHGVEVRALHRTDAVQVSRIALRPGERVKLHLTPVDALFYVLEGRGVATVGEEEREVGPGELVDSPARLRHGWRNDGDAELVFLVIKAPAQTEPTELLE